MPTSGWAWAIDGIRLSAFSILNERTCRPYFLEKVAKQQFRLKEKSFKWVYYIIPLNLQWEKFDQFLTYGEGILYISWCKVLGLF